MKIRRYSLSILGFLFLAAPVAFLEAEIAAGISCSLGLLLSMAAARRAEGNWDRILQGVLLWLAHSIRYARLFGTEWYLCMLTTLAMLPYTLVLEAAMLLDSWLVHQRRPIPALLVVPVGYTAVQWALSMLNMGYITNLMTYWMCIPVLEQNMAWLGEYGMTFVSMLILSIAANVFACKTIRSAGLVLGSSAALLAGLFALGGLRLTTATEPDFCLHVAVGISEEMDFLGRTEKEATTAERIDHFRRAVQAAAEGNADLLVLNEEYFQIDRWEEAAVLENVAQIIQEGGIPVLFCMELAETEDAPGVNKALYFDGDGTLVQTYLKNNLVPFIEAGYYEDGPETPARITVTLGGHQVSLAFVICFDLNDADYIQKIPDDTELLIAPSWDWDTANVEQRRTSARSIEAHTTLLKHTFEGFTYVAGPYGLWSEPLDNRGEYEVVKLLDVPIWEK